MPLQEPPLPPRRPRARSPPPTPLVDLSGQENPTILTKRSEPAPPLSLDPPTFPRRVVSLLTPPPQDYPDSPTPQDLPSHPLQELTPSPPPQKMQRLDAMHEDVPPPSSSSLMTDEVLSSVDSDLEFSEHDLESDHYCESCFCVPCLCYEVDESEQDPFE